MSISDINISTKKLVWIAVVVFSLFAVVTVYNRQPEDSTAANSQPSVITKDTAERSCQDVANTKLQGRDVDVIDLGNYDLQFGSTDNKSTLSWNGKSKDGGQRYAFLCELSSNPENPQVTKLQMGSERLQ